MTPLYNTQFKSNVQLFFSFWFIFFSLFQNYETEQYESLFSLNNES
jgi:hypothetical protein